jgi:tRNA threonylcarbamoyladenosine dehydratase
VSTTERTAEPAAETYAEATCRNRGVVAAEDQERLRTATILVAGCGSIGGAAIEPLVRIGARHLVLADPGEYELNNLNRQRATLADLGRNKAAVAAERVHAIAPEARVRVVADGVTAATVEGLVAGAALIVDGVDVTTTAGLRAKYLLHEHALRARVPLFTGWDMAGAQYVRCYDYRRMRQVFDGRLTSQDIDRMPMWQVLQRLVPARYVPLEMLRMARANLSTPEFAFPQLAYAADLFGALAAHLVVELLAGRPVREHIYLDVHQSARAGAARWQTGLNRGWAAAQLIRSLSRSRS